MGLQIKKRKKYKMVKANIIPILDAVFIFIFFLLMSAQFLEIYEIGSDAPAVVTINEDNKDKKPPLNLTLLVSKSKITIKTGLDGNVYKTIGLKGEDFDYKKLNRALASLKTKHVSEESLILKPKSNVAYKRLVYIMDSVRIVDQGDPDINTKNDKGESVQTRDLFKQVIFETLI